MYTKKYTVRWADLDVNIHMRHSAYNDYAAQTRLMFMAENGLGMEWFRSNGLFPVLFREETVFMKEIHGNETITIDVRLLKMTTDGSRWSIMNRFYKEDGVQAAQLIVDGAWMDHQSRKLKAPPEDVMKLFEKIDRCENFEWSEKRANP